MPWEDGRSTSRGLASLQAHHQRWQRREVHSEGIGRLIVAFQVDRSALEHVVQIDGAAQEVIGAFSEQQVAGYFLGGGFETECLVNGVAERGVVGGGDAADISYRGQTGIDSAANTDGRREP